MFTRSSIHSSIDAHPKTDLALPVPRYYQLFTQAIKPIYQLKLNYEQHKQNTNSTTDPSFEFEIQTRFGNDYPPRPQSATHAVVWCHAVSLGETNTIAPMLDALLAMNIAIWLTSTTKTGFARGQERFAQAIKSGQLAHSYVPVDDTQVVQAFLEHVQPNLAMFVETELWAITLEQLKKRGIASVLVNARLSKRSFQGYARFRALTHSMMHNLSLIIAQDDDSAKRFRRLGAAAKRIRRADSLKWSSVVSDDAAGALSRHGLDDKRMLFDHRPVWVAGSTHDGEDQIVLDAHRHVLDRLPDALLIVVPRHPERFDAVAKLIDDHGFECCRRSQLTLPPSTAIADDTSVLLADSMGELMRWYEASDVSVVCGSLVAGVGGHNPIEPASLAKPIVMGHFSSSCQELVTALMNVSALKVVDNQHKQTSSKALATAVLDWLTQPDAAKTAGQSGQALVQQKQHTMHTQLAMVVNLLQATLDINLNAAMPTASTVTMPATSTTEPTAERTD